MIKRKRYEGEFLSRQGVRWRVEIWQDSDMEFIASDPFVFDTEEPLIIDWPATEKEATIVGSSATLRIESPGDRTYTDLYTMRAGSVRLDVYRNNGLYWSGTLDPEFYEEPYERLDGYIVSLTFTDFGILDRLKYDMSGGLQTVKDIVEHAVAMTKINTSYTNTWSYCSTKFPGDFTRLLSDIAVRSDNFIDEDGEQSTMKEVVEGVLQPLGLRMHQRLGCVWVYDINALATICSIREIYWTGNRQDFAVDKVANEVKITFSPYASSDLLPELKFTDDYDYDMQLGMPPEDDEPRDYSFYPDLDPSNVGDYDLQNFKVACSHSGGEGLAMIQGVGTQYGKIVSLVSGPPEKDCVVQGFVASASRLNSPAQKVVVGKLTVLKAGPTQLMKSYRVFLPTPDPAKRGKHILRLRLDMLMDARYNPFTEPKDGYNEDANDDLVKSNTAWAFVPFSATIYADETYNTPICHYTNANIAMAATTGHIGYTMGEWVSGAGTYRSAWLEYYDPEKPDETPAIRGWQTNRPCCGRPDTDARMLVGKRRVMYDSFAKTPEGQYMPYPPEGGYLEIIIYQGVQCYGWNESIDGSLSVAENFNYTRAWDSRNLYDKVRWLLYGAPQLEVVNANLVFDEVSLSDVEYSGLLSRDARDPIELSTICGTTENFEPTAKGVYFRKSTGSQIHTLTRGGVTDHPEKLLIGTLCSQYANRCTKLTGEARLSDDSLFAYTEPNQGESKFMVIKETQSPYDDTTDATYVEIFADEYESHDNE